MMYRYIDVQLAGVFFITSALVSASGDDFFEPSYSFEPTARTYRGLTGHFHHRRSRKAPKVGPTYIFMALEYRYSLHTSWDLGREAHRMLNCI